MSKLDFLKIFKKDKKFALFKAVLDLGVRLEADLDYQKSLFTFKKDPEFAMFEAVYAISEVFKSKEDLKGLPGEPGVSAEPPSQEELIELIKPLIPEPEKGEDANEDSIIEKVLSKIEIPVPENGKDADEQKIIKEVLKKIPAPKPIKGDPGKDGVEISPKDILKKLLTLSEKDLAKLSVNKELSSKDIKGLDLEIKKLRDDVVRNYGGHGATRFIKLLDVPNSYAGQSGNIVSVKSDESGLEFVTPQSIEDVHWGEIQGTLSDQTDLQNALDLKADDTDLLNYVPYTGATADVDLGDHSLTTGGTTAGQSVIDKGLVVNEGGYGDADADFRAETDSNPNAFVVDASADKILIGEDVEMAKGLIVDTNTLFVDEVNDRVGIGTLIPTQKLEVYGRGVFSDVGVAADITGWAGDSGLLTVVPAGTATGLTLCAYSASASGPTFMGLKTRSTTGGDADTIVVNGDTLFQISANGANGASYRTGGILRFEVDGVPSATSMPGRVVFLTTPAGTTTSTEKMRITNGGNVGIGTTAPTALLHLKSGNLMYDDGTKTIQFGKTGTSYGIFGVTDQVTGDSAPNTLMLSAWDASNANSARIELNSSGGSYGVNLYGGGFNTGGNINLYTWSGTAGVSTHTARLTVLNTSGNVGIGTTAPTSRLHTAGSFSAGYVAKTANYTATISDYTIDCTANTFTITLPTAVGIQGRIYNIKNTGTGVITVDANGTETIDGVLTQTIVQWENLQIQSTNLSWIII